MFETIDTVSLQKVKMADGISTTIGKGTIMVNFGTEITMEAYYAPYFSSNILSAIVISDFFEVIITPSF